MLALPSPRGNSRTALITQLTLIFILATTILVPSSTVLGESDPDDFNSEDDYPIVDDSDRFCNRNDTVLTPTDCRWPCTNSSLCPGGSEFQSSEDCQLEPWQKAEQAREYFNLNASADEENVTFSSGDGEGGGFDESARACRSVCSQVVQTPECCPGFFGSSCIWCPRNLGEICSGHGDCSDGQDGDGSCTCHANFTGMLCERCAGRNMFGPNCTQECRCVNGYCDFGPTGTGNCRQCLSGYHGELCDQEIITCDKLICANNSQCEEVGVQSQCVCDPGYEGQPSNVTACTPIDVCDDATADVCGARECVSTGPGLHDCVCPAGHKDDGVHCRPVNPCLKDDGGCETEGSHCVHTGPNTSQCECLEHYENYVSGEGCSLVDACSAASCDINANCTTVGPDQFSCTCLPGYVGDGVDNCYGNIIDRLRNLNRWHPFLRGQLSKSIALLDSLFSTALREHGPFTVFVPNNRAFRRVRRDFSYTDMVLQPSRTKQVFRQHMLVGKLTLEDLQQYDHYYTLDGNIADLQVKVARNVFKYRLRGHTSKAKVTSRDLPAFNGMIHIVNELLIDQPSIVGDTVKSAMQLIREEGRFNRMQTLISSLGLEHYFEQDNITVFAPENGGLDSLPDGAIEYLTTEEDGKDKLRTLLENHVFPGKITVTDLVNMKRIRSMANYDFNVEITDMGRILLNGKVNVSQAGIPCSNGAYYHIDGPLIPPDLQDILPSRCDIVKTTTLKGSCVACNMTMECPLPDDTLTGQILEGCTYWKLPGGYRGRFSFMRVGCQPACVRSYKIPKCCAGFYGQDCQTCPGGFKNPCSGRGECIDERFGTGHCICDKNFRGDLCDQCLSRYKFGPNCTERRLQGRQNGIVHGGCTLILLLDIVSN